MEGRKEGRKEKKEDREDAKSVRISSRRWKGK